MIVEQQTISARKILLVDDEEDFLWLTGNMLEQAGYRVIQAHDGEEALGLLEKDAPDLVLLDYRMPGRDGLQIAVDVKQRISAVPIIMLTGYAEVESAVEAMKTGIYDYVTKPIDVDDFLSTIKHCLEKQELIEEVVRLRKALEEFKRLITTISTRFINLSSEEIDRGINEALQEIGEFTDVDRSYVFMFLENRTKAGSTYEWCAEGVKPQCQNLKEILIDDELSWFAKRLKNFEVVHLPSVSDLPPEASDVKKYFHRQDVQSLLAIPMTYGGSLVGFLGFDSVRVNKEWTENIITLLRAVGEIFTNALERKHVDEALRESEYYLKGAQAIAHLGHWKLDPETKEVSGSDELFRIFGLTREEATLDAFADVVHPDDREYDLYHIRRGMELGEPWDIEHRLVLKDGTEKTIHAKGKAITDETGKVIELIGTVLDITERKLEEEEKKKFLIQLQQTQRFEFLGKLAGGIAHEFNNALMAVIGNIQLLEMSLSDEKTDSKTDSKTLRKYCKATKTSTCRMATLTKKLLAYARGGKYLPKTISLSDFVRDVLPALQHTLSPDIRLDVDLPGHISYVKADSSQMQMVLSALLSNSDEAIEGEGRIRICTRNENLDEEFTERHPPLEPGLYVSLTVEDDGKGMDEETKNGVFEPFFTTKFQGRGMGMAAAYGIVDNHDGYISVDSELGKGTKVVIYLPANKGEVRKAKRVVGGSFDDRKPYI